MPAHMHNAFGTHSLCGVIYTKLFDGVPDDGTQVDCVDCLKFLAPFLSDPSGRGNQ